MFDGLAELVIALLTVAAAVLGFFLERRARRLDRNDGERLARLEGDVEHLADRVAELGEAMEELADSLADSDEEEDGDEEEEPPKPAPKKKPAAPKKPARKPRA